MKKKHILIFTVCLLFLLAACSFHHEGIVVEDVMIPNEEGTFTKAQIVAPADYMEHKLPLVILAHGFRGTMNSAGAESLSHALAEKGIATIRMDFSHNISEDAESRKTNQYTVDSMVSDQVLCASYMEEHYNIDPDRVGLFGRSLGGRAAMTAANESAGGFDFKAMVLVAPAGNEDAFQRYMGGQAKWNQYKDSAEKQGTVTHQNVVLTPDFFRIIENYVPSEHGGKFKKPVLIIYNTEDNVVLPEAAVVCGESYPDHRFIEVTTKKSPHGLEMGFEKSEIKDFLFEEIIQFYLENL